MFVLPLVALLLCRSLSQDAEPVQETLTSREGRTLHLRCGVSDVTWLKNVRGELKDVTTLGKRRYHVKRDGSMRIKRFKESDAAVYVCSKLDTPIKEITVAIAAQPTISISPSDVIAYTGSLVHLPCEGSGDPEPSIEWKVNRRATLKHVAVIPDKLTEEEIMNHSGGNFLMTESGHLYIRNITVGFSARYVCFARNDHGVSSRASAKVSVLAGTPPKITTRPQDTNTTLGVQVISMPCQAGGYPQPNISWTIETFDGATIAESEHENHLRGRYRHDANGTLYVLTPLPSDSGKYTCTATSATGVAEASAILQVHNRIVQESQTSLQGWSVWLYCGFPRVRWLKNVNGELKDVMTLEPQRFDLEWGSMESITIRRFRKSDEGVYTCTTYDTPIKEITLTMTVQPYISIYPNDVIVKRGSLVHLPCEGPGDPKPSFKWTGNYLTNVTVIPDNLSEEEIINFNSGNNFLMTESGHLYIRDIPTRYSAPYYCIATYKGETSRASAEVSVLDPPTILTRPQNTNISVGADGLTLSCEAMGYPRPKIGWRIETLEGVTIEKFENHPSDRFIIEAYPIYIQKYIKSARGTLWIRFPVPSDSGKYTCVATNSVGRAEASATFQVLRPPVRETQIGLRFGEIGITLQCGFENVTWLKKVRRGKLKDVKTLPRWDFEEQPKYTVHVDGELKIERPSEYDAAVYTCMKRDTPVKEVTVVIADGPTLSVRPSDVTAHIGSLVHLPCEALGNPKPSIEWRVHGTPLRNVSVIPDNLTEEEIMNHIGGNLLMTESGHLYIRNISKTTGFSTEYTCIARNAVGDRREYARVLVLDPPQITTKPQDTKFSLDADVISVVCRARGNPHPTISWRIETFEGIKIDEPENHPSGRYEIDSYGTLKIRPPFSQNSWKYTCFATNPAGVAKASTILQVGGTL